MFARKSQRGPAVRWHGKGWRSEFGMWLNVKRAFYPGAGAFVRGQDVRETELLHSLLRHIEHDITRNEGPLPEGCWMDFQRNRRSLLDEPEDTLVVDVFDGGEIINCKVYDGERREVINDGEWRYK